MQDTTTNWRLLLLEDGSIGIRWGFTNPFGILQGWHFWVCSPKGDIACVPELSLHRSHRNDDTISLNVKLVYSLRSGYVPPIPWLRELQEDVLEYEEDMEKITAAWVEQEQQMAAWGQGQEQFTAYEWAECMPWSAVFWSQDWVYMDDY